MPRHKRTYPAQPRRGFKIGDRVRVKPLDNTILPEHRDFYGDNVGVIVAFLDDPRSANNGAALVRIKPRVLFNIGGTMQQMETQPYICTDQLIPA